MGRKKRPKNAIVLSTYAELERYVKAFADGHLNLLIVIGRPGLQKSRLVRQAVGEGAHWIEGNASAFYIYIQLFENKDQPIVIDDLDSLYSDRAGVRLLKCLCQTEPVKTVGWQTDAKTLDDRGVPRRFQTRSRVIIIANSWSSLNDNVRAVEDRGHFLCFEPEAVEVHRRVAKWFDDQEVFDFIGEWLHVVSEPSMREYVNAAELKRAGLPWRETLLRRWLPGHRGEVAALKADSSYATEEDRVREFVSRTGGCRATYFNHAQRIGRAKPPPSICLARAQEDGDCSVS